MSCPATLLVLAKAPVAGFAKTRLSPPLTPVEAADLAAAALLDTLDTVLLSDVARRVVAFTGDLDAAERSAELRHLLGRCEVVAQRGRTFGERLANAHADAARPALPVLQIGMDTPQVRAAELTAAADELVESGAVVLGPATDGGWWALGLPTPQPARALVGVPMSTDRTGLATRNAMRRCGFEVRTLPVRTDVDVFADALRVANDTTGRFAEAVDRVRDRQLVVP
ncbi:TIGR04282 family arsenosugar biosynthesis glycosyltransferase [Nocardia takedensis]